MTLKIVFLLFFLTFVKMHAGLNFTSEDINERSVVLSRRKRFLVFPEGSSFQLGKYFQLTYKDRSKDYYLQNN